MDRRSEDRLWQYRSCLTNGDRYEEGGYQDPRRCDDHSYMGAADHSWRQRECRERGSRRDYKAYENRGYEPEIYACASDGEVREHDYYRDSGCEKQQSWKRHVRGGDGESYHNDGQRRSQDWHGNYDDDFYGSQQKLTRRSDHNRRGSCSHHNGVRKKNGDYAVDFYNCYGSGQNVQRGKEGEDSFARGYNASRSQRPAIQRENSFYRGYNTHGSPPAVYPVSETRYVKGYHHGQGYSRSSTPEGRGNDLETSHNYHGRLNGKNKGEEEYAKGNGDCYHGSDRYYTEVRLGVHRHAHVSYDEASSYSHDDVKELGYDSYHRDHDQHHERSRKSVYEYDDRHDTRDTYHGDHRNQEESDSEEHPYYRKRGVDDEYLPHQGSPHMDKKQSPAGSFRQRGFRRTDTPSAQRHVDHYRCERESHVYRNSAYESDDMCGSEDASRAEPLYREERSGDNRTPYCKQTLCDDDLSDRSSGRFVGGSYGGGDVIQGYRGASRCSDVVFKSAQLNQCSARKQHAEGLSQLALTPEPAAHSGTAIPKRKPLTPTTFSPNGYTKGGLLEIPRCAESGTKQCGALGRPARSLVAEGSQRFATMKNARRIAEEMGMEEAKADARAVEEKAEEFLEEFHGQIKRTSWAKRNQLQRSPPHEGEKFDAWNLKSFKAMKKASELGRDITAWLTMWSSSLKTIEGHFGTGVVSYFLFLRWLLLLNVLMFVLPALFIVTPHWILPTVFEPNETMASTSVTGVPTLPSTMAWSVRLSRPNQLSEEAMSDIWEPGNRTLKKMQQCYDEYYLLVTSQTKGGISPLQDFLQGTGWLELTALFAGRYINSVDHIAGTKLRYNFPLAYVLTNVACFVLCLLLMVRYTTAGVRESLLVSEGKLHRYCNMVFASWDFCITDERTARLKHVSIVQELKSDLAEERRRAEIASWTRSKKVGLFIVRLLVNLLVVAVVVGSLFAVYHATKFSFQRQSQAQTTHKTLALVIQFVPSLVITGLNIIVPALFSKLIRLENYSVAYQVKLTLLRTVFLRFTSIFVLLVSLSKQINCSPVKEDNCLEGDGDCKKPICWETAVGQQIYKLTMLDFIVGVTLVFVVECPRKLIFTRCQCKLAKVIGPQEFNIPNRVLDLVYSQTLCWLGTFYCPFLPAITFIKYFIIFYVQKFTLMNNSAPSQTPYRASRSNTFFVIVLLLALVFAVIPFAYALVEIQPSLSCGPFQKFSFTWEVVPNVINSWKDHPWGWYVVKAVDFLTSVAFGVPVVAVLAISIYYYYSVAAAHAHMEKVLKDKLVLEGKDKQFLLARITEVARQRPSSTA